jgi:hypothetical protein
VRGGHHVHDHVVQVQQHPVAVALAFFAQRLDALGFDRFTDLVQHRVDLAIGGTGGDDHEVGDALLVANVDDLDVLGLDVFQGCHGNLDQLFASQFSPVWAATGSGALLNVPLRFTLLTSLSVI